ncbi:MAG: DUF4147 domain-containing protein [Gemmatimonadaceae bacterium]|nr:DUF4147 domain-containing protein [Gemmatimonadaceae bacterium]
MSSTLKDTRALLAALYDAAVQGAAPFPCTRDAVARWCRAHHVAAGTRVHVIATGKASPAMTAGALAALGETGVTIVGGVVVAAHDPGPADWFGVTKPTSLRVLRGDHPVPGPASLDAADAIDDALLDIEPGDLAVVLISGGTTALCAAPIAPLAQRVGDADRAQTVVANLASTLLGSGLAIHEMNAIRRRLLRFGAGRLAVQLAHRGVAHIGAFAISDVIGDDPAVIGSGPCSSDPFDDATFLALIDAHGLRDQLSREEAEALGVYGTTAPPAVPAPTHDAFARVQYEVVSGNRAATAAMARAATQLGIETVLVDEQPIEGEADAVGLALTQRALALAPSLPKGHRALLVSGGEPVVHLLALEHASMERAYEAQLLVDVLEEPPPPVAMSDPMRGGRMQVVALSAALQLEAAAAKGDPFGWQITVLAAGTDGRDGPTDAAGAIVDAAVPALARRHGRSPDDDLLNGRSWYALEAAEALLKPGPTGTNVMDVVGVLIRG